MPENNYPVAAKPVDRSPETIPTVILLIILDRSLSMAAYEEQVTTGLHSFVRTLAHTPGPRYLVTVVQFAGEPETSVRAMSLEKLSISYKPNGEGTALWDALAHSLVLEKSRQVPVICLIITDGEDNASREADWKQVRAMIQSRREWGNWVFLWLNLQGKPSKNAHTLAIDCVDCAREDIGNALPGLADRISRAVSRLGSNKRILIEGGR
jgi:hypothetical protein